jgi:hypothetical protein
MAWFYEIRDANNGVLRRDGGFPDRESAKTAARANAKQIGKSPQLGKTRFHRILVGQNTERPSRRE